MSARKKLASPTASKIEEFESAVILVDYALSGLLSRLKDFGVWDDGCFYYNGVSATELEEPMQRAQEALAALAKARKRNSTLWASACDLGTGKVKR